MATAAASSASSPALAPVKASYWSLSRAPRYSLTLALPLLLLYELAAQLVSGRSGVRNGAEVMLKQGAQSVLGSRGPMILLAVIVATMVWVIARDARKNGAPRLPVFFGMAIESALLAAIFGLVVGLATARLITALHLSVPALDQLGLPTALMVSLGAGFYEELLFRVLLVSALLLVARRLLGWGPVASGIFATLFGALAFSAVHYIGPLGDQVTTQSFVFRTIAGLAFSGMYVTRGFGITAWAHALYDVFLIVARGTS
ncbi:MAG TPA: CPBP family intramembrane glutamic endopeptidase [Gemmatimonadaceae bacterium]